MCIVAWIPRAENYWVFSNRDDRPAKAHLSNLRKQDNSFIVLLNGGFENHIPKPPYRASRVEVLDTYFEFKDFNDFQLQFEFQGMEPFTLLVYQDHQLHQLVWTGKDIETDSLIKEKIQLWASATLYTSDQREDFFQQLIQTIDDHGLEKTNALEELFQSTFKYPGNSFGTLTLSTTHIELH